MAALTIEALILQLRKFDRKSRVDVRLPLELDCNFAAVTGISEATQDRHGRNWVTLEVSG